MIPQSREKNGETAVFRHRWHAWKVVRSIAAVRQRPKTPRNWRCSFAFFESFLWHFNKKQRAEMIFRLSRLVSCKKQENGSGKQRSLHAPLKTSQPMHSIPCLHDRSVREFQSKCWLVVSDLVTTTDTEMDLRSRPSTSVLQWTHTT